MTETRGASSGLHLDAAQEAAVLAGALPYLRRYAGDTIVVKYGGHAMGNASLAKTFGRDIALLKLVGINPVVVHGGGPQTYQMLQRPDIPSTLVDGLGVTRLFYPSTSADEEEMVGLGCSRPH